MNKIYAYSYKFFEATVFLVFAILAISSIRDVNQLLSFISIIIISFIAIYLNASFYKKIITKMEVIVERLNPKKIISMILFYLLIATYFIIYLKEFSLLFICFYIFLLIEIVFTILNIFYGTKKIELDNKEDM